MLAIHNHLYIGKMQRFAANAFAKLSKCQQFTTDVNKLSKKFGLQTLLQSYQNVSNSQPHIYPQHFGICCKRFCKVIKMLAIHNDETKDIEMIVAANAFAKLSKCQQFTTFALNNKSFVSLQTLLQSYQNVSNSQPFII